MAGPYGITVAGFLRKPLDVALQELRDAVHATFGAAQDTDDPSGPWAQFLGLNSDREASIWDLAEGVYASRDPDQATGSGLEGACAITGTVRSPATYSTVLGTLAGTAGTIVPKGSVASVAVAGTRFATIADATIAAATAWAGTTAYTLGQRRTNGGNIYEVTIAGTSAGSGGPTGTGSAIVDSGVTWRFVIAGTAFVDATMQAEETGPKIAPAGTLTTIETPVSGWAAATNALDATPGQDIETDAALRIRRVAELAVAGSATPEAVRAEVLKVSGVTACTVFENTTGSTDGNGVPAKAIEVLVTGGVDADIRAAIWNSRSAGIESYGGVSGTVTDSQGTSHTVKFSRPTAKNVYLIVTGTKDATTYPTDGDAQIKAQLVAFGLANLFVDTDVVAFQLKRALTVSGLLDVSSLKLGFAASPTLEATLVIGTREQAVLDTSRISTVIT